MLQTRYTDEEVVRRGETLYEQQIKPEVKDADRGKFLVLDIETGAYEIDANELTALNRVKRRNPDSVLYMLRIGRPAAYRLGRAESFPRPSFLAS